MLKLTRQRPRGIGLAIAAALLAGAVSCAQQRVRLMPQLGMDRVNSVAISPDGRFVLTGGADGIARLWSAATGQQIRNFDAGKVGPKSEERAEIIVTAFSPDGRRFLTGTAVGVTRLWDVESGRLLKVFDDLRVKRVMSVAFSLDGRLVLAGGDDGAARLWDAASGQQIRAFDAIAADVDSGLLAKLPAATGRWQTLVETCETLDTLQGALTDRQRLVCRGMAPITSVAFSADAHRVLTGGSDATAKLWDAETGRLIRSFNGHSGSVNSVVFSPDGHRLLTGSADKTARLWNADTGQPILTMAESGGPVLSVAFSANGRWALTGSDDKSAKLWDARTGAPLRSFDGQPGSVSCVTFTAEGGPLLAGGLQNAAWLKGAETGQPVRMFQGHTAAVRKASFSPDGRRVLVSSADGTASLWYAETGRLIHTLAFKGHAANVTKVAFSPDGREVLTGSDDGTASLWSAETGQLIRTLEGHTSYVTGVAFSPDGRRLLTGSADHSAKIWDAETGALIRSLEGNTGDIDSVAFSPDGQLVATGSDGNRVQLWDAQTGRLMQTLKKAMGSASSLEGQTPAQSGVMDRAYQSWTEILTFITDLVFSPDRRWVLGGSDDDTAKLWNAETGELVRTFEGHSGSVDCVAFSPDGRRVLTGSDDHTAKLWDVETGRLIQTFEGHANRVNSVAFSPDGQFVLTGSDDTTSRVWDVATGNELAALLSFENGGWAVTDPEGRYDSNDPDSTPGLVWVTDDLQPIELKQLKDDYYTPNLFGRILQGERLPDVKGLDQISAPPEVAIVTPYDPQTNTVTLSVRDTGGGVGRVTVRVNDRTASVIDHPAAGSQGRNIAITANVSSATLKPGENTVGAYAFDAGNHIRSRVATATFMIAAAKGFAVENATPASGEYRPQFYAIVIGIARYGNPAMNLLYPEHDAENMMAAVWIGASHLFGAGNVHLRALTTAAQQEENQPTKKNIVAAFDEVRQQAKPTDVLLVYLSGHGVSLRGEKDSYYYLTADARSLEIENDPALKNLSTVSSAELREWLGAKNMPLKEVLILDTCAAGAASEELAKLAEKRDVPPDQRRAVEFLKDATGTVILMGSAADKSSYEASKYGQGLLTYALLDGMHGRSVSDGGQLNVSRWFQNASEEVPLLAAAIGGIQKPQIAAPEGVGFPVALLDPADEAKIPLAAVKPELLHLTCHDDNDEDPLVLGSAVREQMREISHPSARGSAPEPPIVYLDDVIDGPSDTLTPKIVYKVTGESVSLRLRLDRSGKTLAEENLNLSAGDPKAIAATVAAKLVAMAGRVPVEGVNP